MSETLCTLVMAVAGTFHLSEGEMGAWLGTDGRYYGAVYYVDDDGAGWWDVRSRPEGTTATWAECEHETAIPWNLDLARMVGAA